jgi:hypothetical protein
VIVLRVKQQLSNNTMVDIDHFMHYERTNYCHIAMKENWKNGKMKGLYVRYA